MNFNSRVDPSIPRRPQDKKGGIDDIGGGYLKQWSFGTWAHIQM